MKFNYFLSKLPMVEVELVCKDKATLLWALIDTGADYTIFARWVAEELGINIEEGEIKVLEGAGGNMVGYLHPLKIKLCGQEFEVLACFSESNDFPEHILGRKDVINHFKLVFDKDAFELISYEEDKSKGSHSRKR